MLISCLLLFLLSNAVTLRRDKSILYSRNLINLLIASFLLAIYNLNITPLEKGISLFGGIFQSTATNHTFHIFIFLISAAILQLTGFYPRKVWVIAYSSLLKLVFYKFLFFNTKIINKMGEQYKIIEYSLIMLFIIIGGAFLLSSGDIVSVFLSVELQSYGLYLLATLHRNSELATSAGLTYFLLGGLSSCFILLGQSLLYGNSGNTNLDGYYVITSLSELGFSNLRDVIYWCSSHTNYINYCLLIMSVGFLFKVSAAPFHFWSPDVYDAIPTIVTTFVAIVAKISIFIFLLELAHYTNNSFFAGYAFSWTTSLLLSSFLSLIIGTVLGLTQNRIKRLLAYSTISHLGFILLALSINTLESIQAFIFYLMQYTISNLNAFILLVAIGFSFYHYNNANKSYEKLLEMKNSPIQLISQIKGFFYINSVLAISLAITIFSFVGIPPLVGFFAKQMVLSAALDSGYFFLTLVAIITSVVSAVYYLSIIKQVFFDKHEYELNQSLIDTRLTASISNNITSGTWIETFIAKDVALSSWLALSVSILTLIILFFVLNPQEWLSIANILALIILNH